MEFTLDSFPTNKPIMLLASLQGNHMWKLWLQMKNLHRNTSTYILAFVTGQMKVFHNKIYSRILMGDIFVCA